VRADLSESLVEGLGVGIDEGRFLEFVKGFVLFALGLLASDAAAYVIDGYPVDDAVEPGANCAGVAELVDGPEGADPCVLQDVKGRVGATGEAGCVVEQGTFHGGDEVFKGAGFVGLTAQSEPFIPCAVVLIHGRSQGMS
jgi:hypothetical protein